MPTVETVLGPIDAGTLGFTLSHEHVLVAMGEDNHHYPWMFDWERTRANIVRELSDAKAGGVDTIIDLTTPTSGEMSRSYEMWRPPRE
jgi:phosphotriesterase-related protein